MAKIRVKQKLKGTWECTNCGGINHRNYITCQRCAFVRKTLNVTPDPRQPVLSAGNVAFR